MNGGVSQVVYPCEEFGEVAVPIAGLLRNGEIDVYPEVAGRGLFDISYRRGELVLRATKFVGLIPISETVAIQVRPKTSIPNLFWLIGRSGQRPSIIEGLLRDYARGGRPPETPEVLYADIFVRAMERVYQGYVLKRYVSEDSENQWRGRLLVTPSVSRFYARGIHYRHILRPTDLTVDNLENRILKYTGRRFLAVRGLVGSMNRHTAGRLAKALGSLATVDDSGVYDQLVVRNVPRLIRGLSPRHRHYESALWLAHLIASNDALKVETLGSARTEAILVDVGHVFESFIRTVCAEAERSVLQCKVRNGNTSPLPLFVQGAGYTVRPDLFFVRQGDVVAVADVKYKSVPTEEDRYALMAYCESTGARRGVFVLPKTAQQPSMEWIGTSRSGIRIDLLRFDLAAPDLRNEETNFVASVATLIA